MKCRKPFTPWQYEVTFISMYQCSKQEVWSTQPVFCTRSLYSVHTACILYTQPVFRTPFWRSLFVLAGKNEMQLKLDNAMEDVNNKYLALETAEKNAVRTALIEERSRFCFFISYLRPFVVRIQPSCVLLWFLLIYFMKMTLSDLWNVFGIYTVFISWYCVKW